MTTKQLPEGWREVKLGEILKIGRGSSPRPIQDFMVEKNGIPWVKIADATASSNRYIESTKEFIKEEGRSTTVLPGDLIVSNSATPGIPKFMKIEACVHDGWLVFSEYKNLDKLYLYYFFLDYRRRLEHSASGTVFKNLTTEIVRNVPISLPPLLEQKNIASVLSAFDDKIELLQEQNKILESLGQTIFQEWFGKYSVNKPEELPEGWRIGKMRDFIDIFGGLAYKAEHLDKGGDILLTMGSVTAKDRFNYGGYKLYGGPFLDKNILKAGDLILATRDVTQDKQLIGAVAMVPDNLQCENIIGATNLYLVRNKGILENDFLYYIFKSSKYREWIQGACKGTTIVMIVKEDVLNYEFILPDKNTIDKFTEIVKDLREKRWQNDGQTQSLSRSCDNLLPKLMSGELKLII